MNATVPDTSVWIDLLRKNVGRDFLRQALRARTVFLCSVVAYELYLGARTVEDKRDLDSILHALTAANLTVNPTLHDWSTAGVLLERYGRLHGSIDPHVHLNDLLIVLSAAEIGAAVVTWNVKDMARWNRLLPAERRVRVWPPPGP